MARARVQSVSSVLGRFRPGLRQIRSVVTHTHLRAKNLAIHLSPYIHWQAKLSSKGVLFFFFVLVNYVCYEIPPSKT